MIPPRLRPQRGWPGPPSRLDPFFFGVICSHRLRMFPLGLYFFSTALYRPQRQGGYRDPHRVRFVTGSLFFLPTPPSHTDPPTIKHKRGISRFHPVQDRGRKGLLALRRRPLGLVGSGGPLVPPPWPPSPFFASEGTMCSAHLGFLAFCCSFMT